MMDRYTISGFPYFETSMKKLQAYEDTGLEPEVCAEYRKFEDEAISKNVTFNRVVELMNAEAEGLLIVLPCKVGGTVFYLTGVHRNIIKSATINGITLDHNGIVDVYVTNEDGIEFWHNFDIFHLTREEAEKALDEAQG